MDFDDGFDMAFPISFLNIFGRMDVCVLNCYGTWYSHIYISVYKFSLMNILNSFKRFFFCQFNLFAQATSLGQWTFKGVNVANLTENQTN